MAEERQTPAGVLRALLRSRKAWTAVISALAAAAAALGLPAGAAEVVATVVAALGAVLIGAISIEDAARWVRQGPPRPDEVAEHEGSANGAGRAG